MHSRVLGTSGVAHRSAVRQSTASLRLRLLLLLQQKDNARPQAYGCALARSGLAVSYAYNQLPINREYGGICKGLFHNLCQTNTIWSNETELRLFDPRVKIALSLQLLATCHRPPMEY